MKSFPNLITSGLCSVAIFSVLSQSSIAQSFYDWSITDEEAEWGAGLEDTSGGTYTRAHSLIGQVPEGHSSSYGAEQNFVEGPYDGISGMMRAFRTVGAYTRTDPNAVFDLSKKGSRATINTVYHALGSQIDSGGSGHLYQFGLSNNASLLGSTGNESLVVAADFLQYATKTDGISYDLGIFNQDGLDSNPTDGTWDTSPEAIILSNGLLDRIYFGAGESHLLNLIYTNIGDGKIRLESNVIGLSISGKSKDDVVTGSRILVSSNIVLNNPFSDLSVLRPAFGYSINDSNLPTSAANFDWDPEFTQFIPTPTPEPSTTLLGALAACMAAFVRRR